MNIESIAGSCEPVEVDKVSKKNDSRLQVHKEPGTSPQKEDLRRGWPRLGSSPENVVVNAGVGLGGLGGDLESFR